MKYTIKSTACALFSLLLAACSSNSYKESADNESYQAIAGKSELGPGMSQQVLVDEEKVVDLDAFAINEDSYEFLDEEADSEIGAHILNLNIALDLAFQHSKD